MSERPTELSMDRWESVGVVSALGLLLVGILGILLQPWLPESVVTAIQVMTDGLPLSLVLAVAMVLFVGLGLFFSSDRVAGDSNRHRLIPEETPPEIPRAPPAQIGEDFEAAVASAALDVQIKGIDVTETAPREQLISIAEAVLTQQPDITEKQAEAMIESGEWTSDGVAQGFLSTNRAYPFTFRVLRWAQPRLAYERAVDRSVDALELLAAETLIGYTRSGQRVSNADTSHNVGGRVEHLFSKGCQLLSRQSRDQSVDTASETLPQADRAGTGQRTPTTGRGRTVESTVSEEITDE